MTMGSLNALRKSREAYSRGGALSKEDAGWEEGADELSEVLESLDWLLALLDNCFARLLSQVVLPFDAETGVDSDRVLAIRGLAPISVSPKCCDLFQRSGTAFDSLDNPSSA